MTIFREPNRRVCFGYQLFFTDIEKYVRVDLAENDAENAERILQERLVVSAFFHHRTLLRVEAEPVFEVLLD